MRSLKVATRSIMTDETMTPCQDVLTMATIARAHTPNTITGIPPSLSMTGRPDVIAGRSATIWNRDPESVEEALAVQQNATRNILNARNAAIMASAQQAL